MASPDKLSSSSQPKILLLFDVTVLYVQSSNFPFSVFDGEKDRFKFILSKVNAQLVIYKPVTYIGQVLSEFFFYSFQIFMSKWYVSSAQRKRSQSTVCGISLIYNRSNKNPRMDTCETPRRRSAHVESLSWTLTCNFLLDMYDFYQSRASYENPNGGIFRSNILWSTVSNAFWRSIKIIPVRRPESKPLNIFSIK